MLGSLDITDSKHAVLLLSGQRRGHHSRSQASFRIRATTQDLGKVGSIPDSLAEFKKGRETTLEHDPAISDSVQPIEE